MCDTMVALGNVTQNGKALFAKSSDRQPNEPHIMVRVPGRKRTQDSKQSIQTTYIQIPEPDETYEVFLLKPSWIWGCEMGFNEFGLNIGNEAVFTKEKYGPPALLGMDLARLALERCRTSEEAVGTITKLLEEYGQGGNCGFAKPFTYHNSFLIADPRSAWVLETAGPYWAAKKVKDVYAISNCLTLGSDYDKCHPDLVKRAVDKGWCRGEKDFSFRDCYSDKLFTHFSGAWVRCNTSQASLERESGSITATTLKTILRSHEECFAGREFKNGSVRSICMHAGGLIGDHTTGSYIGELGEKRSTYWVTGASTPCLAVFKPVWPVDDVPFFTEEDQTAAVDYWKERERIHRLALAGLIDRDEYRTERDRLEISFEQLPQVTNPEAATDEELARVSQTAFARENQLIAAYLERAQRSGRNPKIQGGWFFNHYWQGQNRKLPLEF
ncbi:MAG TPA: C69 family dipeptidase [Bacillota bacterium]